jgi:hypothetical protein
MIFFYYESAFLGSGGENPQVGMFVVIIVNGKRWRAGGRAVEETEGGMGIVRGNCEPSQAKRATRPNQSMQLSFLVCPGWDG